MSTKLRRAILMILVMVAAIGSANAAGSPFPGGYEEAYRAYRASLTPAQRKIPWLNFDGVVSPPQQINLGGRPAWWTSSCKPHDCGSNIVVVFLLDKSHASSVIYMNGNGRPLLAGGAGQSEVACVNTLFNSGWTATRC